MTHRRTTTFPTLDVEMDDNGVVRVFMNLTATRNALSADMISDLTRLAGTLGTDPDTRAIVLGGAGKVFCAGGDLAWMQAQIESDRATRMREARKLAQMLKALNEMSAPLIGRLHGGAYGGGVGLACVCDAVIASADTRFALSETRLGLIPATIAPYVVARIGAATARRLMGSARLFDAEEALAAGVVTQVVDQQVLDAAIRAEVEPYLACAPAAVAAAKALVRSLGPIVDDATIDATIERLADVWETPQAREGIAAFLEKRRPSWARPGNSDA